MKRLKLNRNGIQIVLGIIIACVWLGSQPVSAQTDERVTVIGTFQPSLGNFEKINLAPDPIEVNFRPAATSTSFIDQVLETQVELESIPPLNITPEPRRTAENNFLQAAIGSRLSPYFMYNHYSPVGRNTRFGLGVRHFSSWLDIDAYAPSDFMQNRLQLHLDHGTRRHTLGIEAFYEYNAHHFYSFKPNDHPNFEFVKNDISQQFTILGGAFKLNSNRNARHTLHHAVKLDYHYLSDDYGSLEYAAAAQLNLQRDYAWLRGSDSKQSLALDADYAFYFNQDSIMGNNTEMKVGLVPAIVLDGKYYYLKTGIGFDIGMGDSMHFYLYPAIHGKLFILESAVEVYSSFTGGLQRNTYRSLSAENPYISPIIPTHWENERFHYAGGAKVALHRNLELHLGVRYSFTENKAFFVTAPEQSVRPLNNQFSLVFDDTGLFQFLAEVAFRFDDAFGLHLSYKINEFTMDEELHPWHEPAWAFLAKVDISPFDKIGFNIDLIATGSRFAPTYTMANIVTIEQVHELPAYFDLNVVAHYQFHDRLKTFVSLNNALHNTYDRFLNYPVHGIQLFAGVSYSF